MPAGITPTITPAIVGGTSNLVQLSTPVFNEFQKWFGVWQMGSVLLLFILCALFFLMRPFIPFAMSKIWSHLPVIGVMTKVRNAVPLGGFTLRNGMYRKEIGENVIYFVKKYLGSYFLMDVPFDIAHIDRGFVQDPIRNRFIISLKEIGYKTAESIENAITFNNVDPNADDIDAVVQRLGFESYEAAHRVLNPSDLIPTTPIFAPKFSNVPLDAILGYGADVTPGNIAAQVSDMFEFQKPPVEEDFMSQWLPWIVFMFAMAVSGAIILSQVR
jgi:hypothetical protein